MADNNCKHYGTMTLTPYEDKGFEAHNWCFYLRENIKGECPIDCPHKDKSLQDWE